MTALHQLLAVKKDQSTRSQQALTSLYHTIQKPEPFAGISKTYQPRDEEGEQLPGSFDRVQLSIPTMLDELHAALVPMFQVVAATDATNQVATADIVVDNVTLARDVPVSTLLWLEKQLASLATVFAKIPVLDPQYEWTFNTAQGVWTTAPIESLRSKKVPRNHVKAHATDKHPEQVEVFFEDVNMGTWITRKLSGAMRASDVKALVAKVTKLRDAVKTAREEANRVEAVSMDLSELLNHIFM